MSDPTSLKTWIQNKLSPLYEASSDIVEAQFDHSFDSVFSSTVEIFLNHVPTTREELKKSLRERAFAATRAAVEWKEAIEVSAGENSQEAGIVAGSFIATRSLRFRIRAAPAQTNNQTIFSAKIAQDSTIESGDQRRIVHTFLTSIDQAAPIHLQSSPNK